MSRPKKQLKKNWIKATITLTLKDRPPGYAGIFAKTFAIGNEEPAPLWIMLCGAVKEISEFYGDNTDLTIDQLNEQIKIAAANLINFKLSIKE